ncbi:chemotaxis protein CheX [Bacillus sp. FJAT-42376]|uniref:chemotaxis protein CheX n=1 Tax=Bacillus sp. FJAT-42376 TaxID=2014076 RepID=UPI000F4D48F6|nr:chemotaxis protein CheX [Bacillus sp. FJAT-42376]AZB43283.1 chemotaxis protein CheX [Bacillus sp. FJAT-42376]
MSDFTYELIISGTFDSIKNMIPGHFQFEGEKNQSFTTAVQIGVVGEVNGRLMIEGNELLFQDFGLKLYGMALEGEMLSSFIGEFANMVAGQMATNLSSRGMNLDITPPILLEEPVWKDSLIQKQEGPLKVSFYGEAAEESLKKGTVQKVF